MAVAVIINVGVPVHKAGPRRVGRRGRIGLAGLRRRQGAASVIAIVLFTIASAAVFVAIFGVSAWIGVQVRSEERRLRPTHTTDAATSDKQFTVQIRPGPPTPRVDLGLTSAAGQSITVACSTCHTNRQPNPETKSSADLNEFHQSVALSHGSITCLMCHNSENYDQLKLADGAAVEFPNVMQLCAQCHGPQMRDFEHGAHGGMNGYWDLKRGPRVRNNCVDCHHPHQPKFPSMQPSFKPYDRFLSDQHAEEGEHE